MVDRCGDRHRALGGRPSKEVYRPLRDRASGGLRVTQAQVALWHQRAGHDDARDCRFTCPATENPVEQLRSMRSLGPACAGTVRAAVSTLVPVMSRIVRLARTALAITLAGCADANQPTTPTPTPTPPVVIGPDGKLDGPASSPALTVIPKKPFTPRTEDYALGDALLPGMPLSINTVILAVRPTATVAQMNALLARVQATIVGGLTTREGSPAGIMAIRLPTRTHAEARRSLAVLRAAPEVLAATLDVGVGTTRVTRSGSAQASWEWILGETLGDPDYGTWGLAAIRMPQTWNLTAHLGAEGVSVPTGVLDKEYDLTPEDLPLAVVSGPESLGPHGVKVASIIAGTFDNGIGVDGVNPFAKLFVANAGNLTSGSVTWGLIEFLEAHPELRVVNVSLGYNWYKKEPKIRASTDIEAKGIATTDGLILDLALQSLKATQPLPVIVASAGNEEGDAAVYSSMFANAALLHNNAAIIVVEATAAKKNAGVVNYSRAEFSSVGGHISAPGARVAVALQGRSSYGFDDGTSFAAPFVTGVVGFLYALEPLLPAPTRTSNVVRDLLVRTSNRGRLDAFAAALELDVVTGSSRVLRRLLDVDDGTIDGNTRIDAFSKAVSTTQDVKKDATVDMADFRRWRDLMVQVNYPDLTALDGAADHPKKDVNGDGIVDVVSEDIFPFADFNGDGSLMESARAVVPGRLAQSGPMTDLEVFKTEFSDPDYSAAELDDLKQSGDIHFRISPCGLTGGNRIRSRVLRSGAVIKGHFFVAGDSRHTVTVKAGGSTPAYLVQLALLNAANEVVGQRETTVAVRIGEDIAIVGCPVVTFAITTSSLTPADSGVGYSATLQATGATTPPSWRIISGALPAGLTLSSLGAISGTPRVGGTFNFRVEATSGSAVAARDLSLSVRTPEAFFTVILQMRSQFFAGPYVVAVAANQPGLERADNGAACQYDFRNYFGGTFDCSIRLPRGAAATFTVQTTAFFTWVGAPGCEPLGSCTVGFDDPKPAIKSRNLSLDLR